MNRIHNINKTANKGAKKLLYQSDDDAVVKVKCRRKKAQMNKIDVNNNYYLNNYRVRCSQTL